MIVSSSNGGVWQLVKAKVIPFVRENLSVRASMVKMYNGSNGMIVSTDSRLRLEHLMSIDTTSSRNYVGAVKDANGIWTEWSPTLTFSASHFVQGGGDCSIGSGALSDEDIQEPAVKFPDLSLGTGMISVHRTIVSGGFADETRRSKWDVPRAAFRVQLEQLDDYQVQLMHRFFSALNGSVKPFVFDFRHPSTDVETRYVVRFRDPHIADEFQTMNVSSMTFTLIEVVSISKGIDV